MTAHLQTNRGIAFSDEEVFQLSHIEETWHLDFRRSANSLVDDEMACQRDMRVRGRRLWAYHEKLGDLWDILGTNAAVVRDGVLVGFTQVDWARVQ